MHTWYARLGMEIVPIILLTARQSCDSFTSIVLSHTRCVYVFNFRISTNQIHRIARFNWLVVYMNGWTGDAFLFFNRNQFANTGCSQAVIGEYSDISRDRFPGCQFQIANTAEISLTTWMFTIAFDEHFIFVFLFFLKNTWALSAERPSTQRSVRWPQNEGGTLRLNFSLFISLWWSHDSQDIYVMAHGIQHAEALWIYLRGICLPMNNI